MGETRARFLCWAQHLPAPVPNYPIYDERGASKSRASTLPGQLLGVFLEFDGKAKYLEHRRDGESIVDCVLREKQRESRICELTGWRCIRIVWADLYRPAETAMAHPHTVPAAGSVSEVCQAVAELVGRCNA